MNRREMLVAGVVAGSEILFGGGVFVGGQQLVSQDNGQIPDRLSVSRDLLCEMESIWFHGKKATRIVVSKSEFFVKEDCGEICKWLFENPNANWIELHLDEDGDNLFSEYVAMKDQNNPTVRVYGAIGQSSKAGILVDNV